MAINQKILNRTFWTDPLILKLKMGLRAHARTRAKPIYFEAFFGVCSQGPVQNFLELKICQCTFRIGTEGFPLLCDFTPGCIYIYVYLRLTNHTFSFNSDPQQPSQVIQTKVSPTRSETFFLVSSAWLLRCPDLDMEPLVLVTTWRIIPVDGSVVSQGGCKPFITRLTLLGGLPKHGHEPLNHRLGVILHTLEI